MTPSPRSLLDIAGAPRHVSPPDRTALVLIDVQREYRDGALPLPGIDAAVAEAARLLEAARRRGVPVFHVVQHAPPGRPLFDEAGPMVAILPACAPRGDEAVVVKRLPNAFAGTGLAESLNATGRTELLVAGFMTHMCVSATVRAALDLGLRSTVVASATATRDLPDPLGGPALPAATVHHAALAALADRFAIVVPDSATLLRAWGDGHG